MGQSARFVDLLMTYVANYYYKLCHFFNTPCPPRRNTSGRFFVDDHCTPSRPLHDERGTHQHPRQEAHPDLQQVVRGHPDELRLPRRAEAQEGRARGAGAAGSGTTAAHPFNANGGAAQDQAVRRDNCDHRQYRPNHMSRLVYRNFEKIIAAFPDRMNSVMSLVAITSGLMKCIKKLIRTTAFSDTFGFNIRWS